MGEWRKTRLGDLIDIKHGYAFKGEYFRDEPPGDILLTPGNFAIGGGFQWQKRKRYLGPIPDEYLLSKGDLLVTMTDLSKNADTLGYGAIVPASDVKMLHNQRLGKVIINSDCVDCGFLHWLLRSSHYRNEIVAGATGSTVKHTSPTRILAFTFLLPPLPEQRAIAAVLSALDDKIALNRRMNETLERQARALFKDWFVDFGPTRAKASGAKPYLPPEIWPLFPDRLDENGVPEEWVSQSVIDQAEWINGAAYKNMHFNKEPDALPVIKIAELKAGVTQKTKWTDTALGDKYKITTGELLFSWSGNPDTSIDAFIWTGGDAWLNQHIFAVRSNGMRSPAFLYTMLKGLMPEFSEIARNKQTTGLGHVTKQDLKRMKIHIGSNDIIDEFEKLVGPIYARLQSNLIESRTLAQTRDLLLPKLMSGALRVGAAEKIVEGAL